MSDAQQWYAGLPVTGSRRLALDERRQLKSVIAEVRRIVGGAVATLVLAFTLLAIGVGTRVCGEVPLLGWLPLVLLITRRRSLANAKYLEWLFALRRDAREGTVLVCSGSIAQVLGNIRQQGRAEDPITIEVLPQSSMLWTRNGQREGSRLIVPKSTTSMMSEHARMAANFVKPIEGNDALLMHQRTLNDSEVEEVLRSIPPFPTVRFLAVVAFALGFAVCAMAGWITKSVEWVLPALVATVCAATVVRGVPQRIRFRRAMRNDARVRTAIIVRHRQEDDLGPAEEFLAASGVIWSRDAQPAPWRRMRG